MSAQNQNSVQLATYGSLLHRPLVGWLVAIILALFSLGAVSMVNQIVTVKDHGEFVVLLQALVVAGLISILPVLILRWLDRREPEPWFMYAVAFFWGGLIACGISGVVNDSVSTVIGPMLEGAFIAPFVEEITKGLGLLAILAALRSEFDGPRDGFIYGALIGLGFTWMETSIYIINGLHASGVAPWGAQLSSRYAALGFGGHALYTGVTGTFIGFAMLQKDWAKRILLVAAGFALAIFSHILWNSIGIIVSAITIGTVESAFGQTTDGADAPADTVWYVTWLGTLLALPVLSLFAYIAILVGLRKSGRWERATMKEQLADESDGIVSADERNNIDANCDYPKAGQARGIYRAQCRLAKRKRYLNFHGLPVAGDPVVESLRAAIVGLQRQQT